MGQLQQTLLGTLRIAPITEERNNAFILSSAWVKRMESKT